MKTITSSIFILLFFAATVYSQDMATIRLAYKDASRSEEKATTFYELVKSTTQAGKPVLVAYKGAGLMLLARYEKLIRRKGKIKEAATWIEKAVSLDSQNPEIRLIRLSVQENLPKFIKYNKNIEEDTQLAKEALNTSKDSTLKEMINGYFSEFSTKN